MFDSETEGAAIPNDCRLTRRQLLSQLAVGGFVLAFPLPVTTEDTEFSEKLGSQIKGKRSTSEETNPMPLIRIDALEGRSDAEIKTLLDATHRAVLAAFGVPLRDRYQIYQVHRRAHVVIQDTGLGIARTDNVVMFTVFSKQRAEPLKTKLYAELARELQSACSIAPNDVVVCIVENTGADWSFGNGVAQFLTGDLK